MKKFDVTPLLQHIERAGRARTPDLAAKFDLTERRVITLLAPYVEQQILVACKVINRGHEMQEYRCMGGKLGHRVDFRHYVISPATGRNWRAA